MPETRLRKTRASLPEGYQFGDAAKNVAHLPDVERAEPFAHSASLATCAEHLVANQSRTYDLD